MVQVLTLSARKSKGLTLRELSALTGISKTTLNDIENNIKSPTLDQLEKISIALNTRFVELFSLD